MKSSKKVTKSGGPKKKPGTSPGKKQDHLNDPKESNRLFLDGEEEVDFDIQLDDDIQGFDDFDVEDDDDF